jgi:hypothetical protein
MRWLRMAGIALRLSWPCVLAPWRSPVVRWRLETYGVEDETGGLLAADEITAGRFVRFVWGARGRIGGFLRWAASL